MFAIGTLLSSVGGEDEDTDNVRERTDSLPAPVLRRTRPRVMPFSVRSDTKSRVS